MDKRTAGEHSSVVTQRPDDQWDVMPRGRDRFGVCPYFRIEMSNAETQSTLNGLEVCYATPRHFTPAVVHQHSCCLDRANFARCPYYLGAMGKEKRQIDLQLRKRSATARLRDQLARLLSFRRSSRSKRRRIHVVI